MNQPKKGGRLALWLGVITIGVIGIVGLAASNPTSETPAAATASVQSVAQQNSVPTTQAVAPSPTLSNNNYYTNIDGNSVHSPADSSDGCVAAGATAECGDGTCSFSQHRSGTCSHHGGVSQWLQ